MVAVCGLMLLLLFKMFYASVHTSLKQIIMFVFLYTDMEPPRIQCPSVKEKIAEPNKLTSRVFWDTPEGRDTADGILTE